MVPSIREPRLREILEDLSLVDASDDALRAAMCELAGAGFLRGEADEPTTLELPRKKVRIWAHKPFKVVRHR